ncbi:transcriptional regulator [Dokdonia sp. Dokd-P16]|uniref:helix-turn-helix domain-containing protein n=1 Tax=Dokdonia sp. Dokd-P16 TaxID=2173169 RepID=UPI000D5457DE|nr:helix-turn-helix transcriptional regulator [Dokdonia sp. Dokd-P16]AWH73896.1 transcriptional regulator [Dokdonia sp. Dokd-P16]
MMKQPELGQKILELRQQKGLTQEELVEQCNISVRTIQRIEAGETMPRIYTIKTILSALDRDLDDLQEDTVFEAKVKKAMLINLDEDKDVSYLFTQLHVGWIAGILSMIAFVFELVDDFYFVAEGTYYFGKVFTIILGILSIIFFSVFMRTFILIGNLFKNNFLKIISTLFIIINAILAGYALIDMNYVVMPMEAYGVMYIVFFGVMSMFFGYSLFKLKGLGQLPQASGILQMVLGFMMLTIFLAIVAGPASILAQAINVALILRVYEIIKKQVG